MDKNNSILDALIKGYGTDFPGTDELFKLNLHPDYKMGPLTSPFPATARYFKNISFMSDVTSPLSIGSERLRIMVEYFISLCELMTDYKGKRKKIGTDLTEEDKKVLRQIPKNLDNVVRAEFLEKFTDHDTAAAGDLLKIIIATKLPHLASFVEAVHFNRTSEDAMSNVFGIVGNKLVYGHLIPNILELCIDIIMYTEKYDSDHQPLILPALTHKQSAIPNTLRIKLFKRVFKIIELICDELMINERFKPFTGNLSGPIGNFTCDYACYPDINWHDFAESFVTGLGLKNEEFSDQCSSYTREVQIFGTINNILGQVIKLTQDFIDMVSCPAQLFVKVPKAGKKGSSIMPGKSNLWAMEGAIEMLLKAQNNLSFLAQRLPLYPHEGNMGRSFLFRDIGNDFAPIFIAFTRIRRELKACQPNQKKIDAFLNEYPGMSGAVIQNILKRENISGDAYRELQKISINSDGGYANSEEFHINLSLMLNKLDIPDDIQYEIHTITQARNMVKTQHLKCGNAIKLIKFDIKFIEFAVSEMKKTFN